MGTHLIVLSESYLMVTNMTGFRWFSKIFASLFFEESTISIGMVKTIAPCDMLTAHELSTCVPLPSSLHQPSAFSLNREITICDIHISAS